ncbi:hypothetical protein UMM65_02250 [Aureibaculum sp. 2210JD6-5]|uniref:hypothetical protein n=1 Tax=Aureibaculum sp. 2210JD6-5 TaxID=3103957 RepID=UPI002AAE7F71|nr:hypothetical protein [Aureibaculum sp. 2210JD6-5]MDY7394047.1 hypothetical protein [Aureibaculum sp. 2210JD6-5]
MKYLIILLLFVACTTPNDVPEIQTIPITGQVFGEPKDLPDSIFLTVEDLTIDDILIRKLVKNHYKFNFDISHNYNVSSSLTEDNFMTGIKHITNFNQIIYNENITVLMYDTE